MRSLIIYILVATTIAVVAQPATDIHLYDLVTTDSVLLLSNGKNITPRAGYDNQPHFHQKKPLLFFVSADAQGRTDIFEHNYRKGRERRVTQTHDKEYSPTLTPDGRFLSCILQKDNGAQYLVKYPVRGGGADTLINNRIIGYHAWVNERQVLVFTLPQPFNLELIDVTTGIAHTLTDSIGRSLHRIPGTRNMSFIQRTPANDFEIRMLEVAPVRISTIAKALPGTEHDMAWTPDKKILMSSGKDLFVLDQLSGAWKKVKFTGTTPAGNITRIAVSADGKKIALVISE